jgi:hypothetical protein
MEEINMESIKRTEIRNNRFVRLVFGALLTFALFTTANGQANNDENKVPDYTLPELLTT